MRNVIVGLVIAVILALGAKGWELFANRGRCGAEFERDYNKIVRVHEDLMQEFEWLGNEQKEIQEYANNPIMFKHSTDQIIKHVGEIKKKLKNGRSILAEFEKKYEQETCSTGVIKESKLDPVETEIVVSDRVKLFDSRFTEFEKVVAKLDKVIQKLIANRKR